MKQVMKLGMIFALSVTATHCSRDEAEQVNNTVHEKKTKSPILSGQSVPTSDLGNKGDYYFDLSTYKLYGPKKANGWGTPITLENTPLDKILIGECVPTGKSIGNKGDWYINKTTNTLYGPKGDTGWEGGEGFVLGNGEYTLSSDKKTLLKWTNIKTVTFNMQNYPELRDVTTIDKTAFALKQFIEVTIANGVTSIGDNAFYYNVNLVSVSIPNSVMSIGIRAFSQGKLTSVIIPSGITIINEETFSNNRLTSVTIPDGVTNIGKKAFFSNRLTSINIPSKVTNIGKEAFHSNDNLREVTIHAINPPIVDSPFELNNANLKIYVPAQSVNAYKTAEGWIDYADKIEAIK